MELDYKAIGKRIKIARIKVDLTQATNTKFVLSVIWRLQPKKHCAVTLIFVNRPTAKIILE